MAKRQSLHQTQRDSLTLALPHRAKRQAGLPSSLGSEFEPPLRAVLAKACARGTAPGERTLSERCSCLPHYSDLELLLDALRTKSGRLDSREC
jgi:hypothetical protein